MNILFRLIKKNVGKSDKIMKFSFENRSYILEIKYSRISSLNISYFKIYQGFCIIVDQYSVFYFELLLKSKILVLIEKSNKLY
jgi:hypothetical protein